MRAYVLIEVAPGQLTDFRCALGRFDSPAAHVLAADLLTGPYDAILLLEVADLDRLGECLTDGVHAIVGVTRTTTCVALRPS